MNDSNASEETLFEAVSQLPAEKRGVYLAEACGADAALRVRLEVLLRAHDRASSFMAESAAPAVPRHADLPIPLSERLGDHIGHYKLLQQLGEGGCGVVYVAEQEAPVRRKVALKIIKLGMDTKNVVARFEAERQALAMMDHPNIAKVLDAGATVTGRPFFVMELVRGTKITEYCDQNQLSTRERLELFTKVCQAVQHAHQKGIIHRDLKPSNILVTVNDGVPLPKVIDFGIAKATEGRLTEMTIYTDLHQFIGTPAYMSPEQATMTSLDIDTRSDIYSLGVLLYELLTGHTPFDTKELMALAVDELRRTIREKEPMRPSTRLSTMLEGELTTTAGRRASEPPKLIHQVRSDLDWIVMKALEKDRTRRYETTNGLALDIQRHLNSEPVFACPPTTLYRLRKAVQRNKTAFAAAVAIAAVLIIGIVASMSEAIRATRAEREQSRLRAAAETEAARSQQVAQFLKDMLKEVGPRVARGRDTKLLREILDQTAQRLGSELKGQPAVEADMRATLGNTYHEIGDLTNALEMDRKALALRQKLYGMDHPDVASSLLAMGNTLYELNRLTEAETYARQALAMQQKLLGPTNLPVAQSLDLLGIIFLGQGNYAAGETTIDQALALHKRLSGDEGFDVAQTLNFLGAVLRLRGRNSECEAALRQALAICVKQNVYEHPVVVGIHWQMGFMLQAQGKLGEAEAAFRNALEMGKRVEPENPSLLEPLLGLANVLSDQGKSAEAEEYYREAMTMECQLINKGPTDIVQSLCVTLGRLAHILNSRGISASSEPLYGQAVDTILHTRIDAKNAEYLNDLAWGLVNVENPSIRDAAMAIELAQTAVSATDHTNANYLDTLGVAYATAGQFTNAVRTQQEALTLPIIPESWRSGFEGRLKLYQTNTRYRDPTPLDARAHADLFAGKYAEAESTARESLAIHEAESPRDFWTFSTRSILGGSLLGQGKYEAAEPLLLSAYVGMKQHEDQITGDEKIYFREALQRLAQLYEETKHPDKAAECQKQLAGLDADKK